MLAAGTLTYLIAVTQRTTFGIAGVEATERFDVSAAAVSSIAVLQVAVYAAMQIPVGILVDRYGSTPLIIVGALVMGTGQLLLALSPVLAAAIAGRVLVGVGDALTFVSVIRLLPFWFRGPILPQLSQWVGMVGQFGQIVSALPFAFLLHGFGWTPAFLIAAGGSLLAAGIALALVRPGQPPPDTGSIAIVGIGPRLRAALRRPGTQLGFWVHLVAGTGPTAIGIMWGYPLLTAALGYRPELAAGLMSLLVIGGLVAGPIIGLAISRHPLRRTTLVLGIMLLVGLGTVVMIAWPGRPPILAVAAFLFLVGTAGPGSLVGFDVARTFNPSHALGSASGIVNVGGFLGGFVSMFLIGLVLDGVDAARVAGGAASDLYAFDSFRLALLVPIAVCIAGSVGLLVARRRTRRVLYHEQGIAVAPLWVALFRRRRRTRP